MRRNTLALGLMLVLLAVNLGPALQAAPPPESPLQNPSFGPIAPFNDGSASSVSVASLQQDKFVVAFVDSANSFYGTAVVAQVSNGTITYGPEYVFNAAGTNSPAVEALNSGRFVVVYRDSGNSNYGTAVVGNISGTTITFGSEYVFNAAATEHPSPARLLNEKFAVAYQDGGNSSYGTAIVGTLSGPNSTVITFGGEYVFNAAATGSLAMAQPHYGQQKLYIAFRDNGNSDRGTAIVGDVGGNGYVITYGSEYVFNHGITSNLTIVAIDSWKLVIAYQDRDNSYYGTAVVGDVSGTALSYGSEYVFNSASTEIAQSFGIARLSDDRFVVGYENIPDTDGRVRVGVVSGTTVSYGSAASYNAGSNSSLTAVAGFGKQIAVCWRDDSDSGIGKSRVGGGVDPTAVEMASFQSESGAAAPLGLAGLLILGVTGAAWTIRRRWQGI